MAFDNLTLSQNDKTKLTEWLDAGMKVTQEITDLKEGLKETTKALAEEFDIKPAILNKVLRAACKANLEEEKDGLNIVEEILMATGRA